MSFPYYKISKKIFEKSVGENYGVYVVSYANECVCKIGVTSDPRSRLAAISGYAWTKVKISSFFFPYKPASEFSGLPDDYNIMRVSAYAFEKTCHDKLKEMNLHLRNEFFELFEEEAAELIPKIAEQSGFRLAKPTDILSADVNIDGRSDDRLAFIQVANAAGLAKEVMDAGYR